jgi:hypothetical protein
VGFKSSDPAFKLAMLVLGPVQVGSAPQRKMALTFIRDGTVTDVPFSGCTESLFGGPYAYARPLARECFAHPSSVSLPMGYDTR